METPQPQDNDFFKGMCFALPVAIAMWVAIFFLARAFFGDITSWFTRLLTGG